MVCTEWLMGEKRKKKTKRLKNNVVGASEKQLTC